MKPISRAHTHLLYIPESALEYFVSLMVSGAFLAKVASQVGLSDSAVGLLTSFVSLGCGFQLVALFLRNRTPVKGWVIALHTVNQLSFAVAWLIPLLPLPSGVKQLIFILLLLLGNILNNVVNPAKINWYMSFVPNKERGVFTANKEIVSLLSGMVVSYVLGVVYDFFEGRGQHQYALIFGGIALVFFALSHTFILSLSAEKPQKNQEKPSLRALFSDRTLSKPLFAVIGFNILWTVSLYVTTSFYGTWQVKELGFSMTFVSLLSVVYALVRAAFSRRLGRFADRRSFASMLNVCLVLCGAAFFLNIFTVPANGKILYSLHYILFAVASAGLSSSPINLMYDYIPASLRTEGLALSQSIAGLSGFLATWLSGFFVDWVQATPGGLFGLGISAQQCLSGLGAVLMGVSMIYLNTVIRRLPKTERN